MSGHGTTDRYYGGCRCHPCKLANRRRWAAANRDKVRAAKSRWRAANRDKVREASRRYYLRQRADENAIAAERERQRRWRAANPDANRRHCRRWLERNKLETATRCEVCGIGFDRATRVRATNTCVDCAQSWGVSE